MANTNKGGRPVAVSKGVRREVFIPGEHYAAMIELANANDRSYNAEVRRAVRLYLESEGKL